MQTQIIAIPDNSQVVSELKSIISLKNKVVIITDSNVHEHILYQLLSSFDESFDIIELEPGEGSKSFEVLQHILESFIQFNLDKKSLIINVGGGVVTDVGGFAAAIFKRGIPYINIPTSLIGMADAAIGGKTAIDLQHVKNIVGAFHQPEKVIICPDYLDTLQKEEILSGFAEMIKTAVIADPLLFETLEYLNPEEVEDIKPFVQRCAILKDKIVRKDPFDENIRKTLNFGHTIGHALEAHFLEKDNALSHGFAIALGMKGEAFIAFDNRMLSADDFSRIKTLIDRHFQKISPPELQEITSYLLQDKKNEGAKIRMALPTKIGSCEIDVEVSLDTIERALAFLSV